MSQQNSDTVGGFGIEGTITLAIEDKIDFQDSLGVTRGLIIKLNETLRGTDNFIQLNVNAYLEVTCDFRKFITFNGINDDSTTYAYELTPITLTNNTEYVPANTALDQRFLLSDNEYFLNLKPALSDPNTTAFGVTNATYDDGNSTLYSYYFPVGAVLIDLASQLPGKTVEDKVITISPVDNPTATYQVKSDHTEIGMTLFGQLSLDCKNIFGSPTLSAEATFQPSSLSIHPSLTIAGFDASLTIALIDQDTVSKDSKAQILTVNAGNDTTGNLNITYGDDLLSQGIPNAATEDKFDITISLADLGGEGVDNSVGQNMISAIKAGVSAKANLLKTVTINVDEILSVTSSNFSLHLRTLATDGTGRNIEMPINHNETFILKNPTTVELSVTPFNYSFTGPANINPFNLLELTQVYAVLKHDESADTPVLDRNNGNLLTVQAS